MKTHEIKTNKGEFVVVEFKTLPKPIVYMYDGYDDFGSPKESEYKLICKLSEATEKDASKVVDEDNDYGITLYQNYATTSMQYFDEQLTAIDSLHSLLKSKAIDINNSNLYLFKKI